MAGFRELVQWRTMAGEPTTVGDTTVTPESSALIVRFPAPIDGGFVWSRPTAVVVRRGEETRRIPIVDVTRVAQLGLLVGTAALGLMVTVLAVRRKEQSE